MKSFKVNDLLSKDLIMNIKNFIYEKGFEENSFQESMSRYTMHMQKLGDFNTELTRIINKAMKDNGESQQYEIGGIEIAKYQKSKGKTPNLVEHLDPGVWWDFVADILIDSTIDWPIVIEGKSFTCKPGDSVFIYSTKEKHYRPKYPSDSENDFYLVLFCWMISKEKYEKMPKNVTSRIRNDNRGYGPTLEIQLLPSNNEI